MIKLSPAARARIEETIEARTAMGSDEDRQEAADLTMLLKAHDVAAGLLTALKLAEMALRNADPIRHTGAALERHTKALESARAAISKAGA